MSAQKKRKLAEKEPVETQKKRKVVSEKPAERSAKLDWNAVFESVVEDAQEQVVAVKKPAKTQAAPAPAAPQPAGSKSKFKLPVFDVVEMAPTTTSSSPKGLFFY